MSEENAPETQEEEKTMPSAGKQLTVMALIVVGIVVVLGGAFMLSQWMM